MSLTEIIPITSSLALDKVIPLTPEALRPIGLVLASSKRIALPDFKASIT